jgi:hypothetical protein
MDKYNIEVLVDGTTYRGRSEMDGSLLTGTVAAEGDRSERNLRAFVNRELKTLAGVLYAPRKAPYADTPKVMHLACEHEIDPTKEIFFNGQVIQDSGFLKGLNAELDYKGLVRLVVDYTRKQAPHIGSVKLVPYK